MRIEVIAIGSEVLRGFTINTNAAFIGQELLGIGLAVSSQRTLPDDPVALRAGLKESLDKFDLIICTGGLGPTCDDQTRQIIAELFNCELKTEPKIAEHLKKKFASRPISLDDQCLIPSKASYILNEMGTASALLIEENSKLMICLPGVPYELQHFMRTEITPLLAKRYPNECSEFHQQCNFVQLSESQVDPILRELKHKYPAVDFGIYPNLGIISVHIISFFPNAELNLKYQQPIKAELCAAFADNFFSERTTDLAQVVSEMCQSQQIRINLLQTKAYPNLNIPLAAVIAHSECILTTEDCAALLSKMENTPLGNLFIAITDLPCISAPEEVYTGEISLGLQVRGQNPQFKKILVRGNKFMLYKRAENQVLAEIFHLLKSRT